ncbi:MAG: Uronate isomerase [Chloroflexi bacterium ADurb.Bin325]|nr:MAG: Uronate isomerase [Chloroflexi bacterium ADurb.Bin325]
MPSRNDTYTGLRAYIEQLPVIDCHEHALGPEAAPDNREPIAYLIQGYMQSDLWSAVWPGWPDDAPGIWDDLNNHDIPTEQKWPLFERIWRLTEHTGYARVSKRILAEQFAEPQLTLAALQRIRGRLPDLRDPAVYAGILDRANIRCRLVNTWPDLKAYLDGAHRTYERDRFMIPLPGFHSVRSWQQVWNNASLVAARVTTLDDYVAACREAFRRMQKRGAAGMKDQSAYERTLAFGNPSHAEAEALFNRIAADPRAALGWPEAKSLQDYLFHRFMETARDLDMPVQLHTGHMAGIRNDIAKTNAVHLIPLLELHRDVRFDLFHGNWPYMGEYLYLGKNYPNVHLDLCWLPIIDPVYATNLLSEGLTAVPHSKFHAFGGDYFDSILHAVAHLSIARDVVAAALAERVDAGWIDRGEAERIAADWLHNNPNDYFRLGFPAV